MSKKGAGSDGANASRLHGTISDKDWESLNRRLGARSLDHESDEDYQRRTVRSDDQREKREQS